MTKKIKLTESELTRLIERIVNEGENEVLKIEDVEFNRLDELGLKAWTVLGNVYTDYRIPNEFKFFGPDGKKWAVSKEWVWNEIGVNDQPKYAAEPNGKPTNEFRDLFNNRQEIDKHGAKKIK